MSSPRISVLLTAYNREKYIGDSIESVLAQQFTDFELLIVDDCSTDHTVEIARKYEKLDARVRLFENDRNLGQFPNRNLAARLARGEFIKFHDSDDLMYPHCLSTMIGPMLAEPSVAIGLSLSRWFPGGPSPMLLTPRLCYQREFLGQGMFIGGPACGIFRREEFLRLGGFPEQGVASDALFWLSACVREKVLTLPCDLFWYRIHSGQALSSPSAANSYTLVTGAEWRALSADECPLVPSEREAARRTVVVKFVKALAADLMRGDLALAARRYRNSGLTPLSVMRYLRRPRRTLMAGTPFTPDGEFIVPDWSIYAAPSSGPPGISPERVERTVRTP